MLALHHAYEIKEAISGYLDATFEFSDREVAAKFRDLIDDQHQGLFKGPYISIKLPFKQAPDGDIPLLIQPSFPPFRHQQQAFSRLTTKDGHKPQPTILTTGTGSGKTESFLYPLLDYCYHNQYRRGIKAIIMYPMNALATDQAKRLAEAINADDRLRGRVTAGLFIGAGQGGNKSTLRSSMGPDNIIEDREVIMTAPPDILLTNFKMLDFALIRGSFQQLWAPNHTNPDMFRFFVLDELHTYDGVQGTEVAMLIRRLKAKLNLSEGQLCPVGTSATLGSTLDARTKLAEYATAIFGEPIDTSAIIEETRLTLKEYYGISGVPVANPLRNKPIEDMRFQDEDSHDSYFKRQLRVWDIDENANKSDLGQALKAWKITYQILEIASESIVSVDELVDKLAASNPIFSEICAGDREHGLLILQSLLTLMTEAGQANTNLSFAYIRVQIWVKSLSQVLRTLGPDNRFVWRRQATELQIKDTAPPFYCRDCGGSGWYVMVDQYDRLKPDSQAVYEAIFKGRSIDQLRLLVQEADAPSNENSNYKGTTEKRWYDVRDQKFMRNDQQGAEPLWPVSLCYRQETDSTNKSTYHHDCPYCGSTKDLTIIGTGMPTLASVAASQTLATSLDDATDQTRKLLAFSNTVQDASYHASFIQSRAYNFSYRFALLKVVKSMSDPSTSVVRFDQLFNGFNDFWLNSLGNETDFMYRFFPPDKAGEVNIKQNLGDKQLKAKLLKEVKLRNTWQLVAELGYNSRIGRTLEKSYSLAVDIDISGLTDAVNSIQAKLPSIILYQVDDDKIRQLLVGFLTRIRLRGGLDHEYLADIKHHEASKFHLNRKKAGDRKPMLQPYMSKRMPYFAGEVPGKAKDLIDNFTGQPSSWFINYISKYKELRLTSLSLNDVFYLIKAALINTGYLQEAISQDTKQTLYFLNPQRLQVGHRYYQLSCQTCGHIINATSDPSVMDGAKCLKFRCQGQYQWDNVAGINNYYKKIYNRARVPRIYAHEHTGLLDRTKREQVEISFKNRPNPDATNVLVATSTLEMGIDIGDLNVVYNTAIPPTPANFLQRVGRAGRKSGSALIVNFASAKEHDQFYFDDPIEMMDGEVVPPGCFLNAKDILRRHLMAYYLDEYAREHPADTELFGRYLQLAKANNLDDESFFANRINTFIRAQHQILFAAFRARFDDKNVAKNIWADLGEEVLNGSFGERLKVPFVQLKSRREELSKQQNYYNQALKDPNVTESNRSELKRAAKTISVLIQGVNNTRIVEYLTDQGVLPNYAFPETGITLQASISNKEPNGEWGTPETIKLVRSAKSGLRELAPGNYFYTQGYRLPINGIEVPPNEHAMSYRICSNCDHVETDISLHQGACPKCTNTNWASDDSIIYAIDFRTAKADTTRRDALSEPDHDDRDKEQYKTSLHFDLYNKMNAGARVMEDIPFGIELVRLVEVREFNLGHKELGDGVKQTINGQEFYKKGYVVCKRCNKATIPTRSLTAEKYHYAYCRERAKLYEENDPIFMSFVLGRNFTTEVIKFLLPIDQFNQESKVALFKAGLQIGLDKLFKASVQHLEFVPYQEYNHRLGRADNYLVLYDTIPGGSGFLDELMKVNIIKEVIVKAYEHLRACSCRAKGLDGCYKCVYSYGNQFSREELTRSEAERLFKELIDYDKDMVEVDSLGTITLSGKLEESELELAFVDNLKHYLLSQGAAFETIHATSGVEYTFTLPGKDPIYRIKPQVEVDLGNDRTRVDFMITTTSNPDFKLALYLDGYQFHASEEHFRLHDDLQKRTALINQGYQVFALTYDDVKILKPKDKGEQTQTVRDHLFEQLVSVQAPNLQVAEMFRQKDKLNHLETVLGNNISRFMLCLASASDASLAQKYLKLLVLTVYQTQPQDAEGKTWLARTLPIASITELELKTSRTGSLDSQISIVNRIDHIQVINREDWRHLLSAMNLIYLCR